MIVHHYTNVWSYKEIKSSDSLLPLSPRSPLAKTFFLSSILPKSYIEKGVYCIRDEDLKKWNSDYFASSNLSKSKSKGGNLIKLTLEILNDFPVEILEERIIFYDVYYSKKPFIPFGLYTKHINSRTSLNEYKEDYHLPSSFIKKAIPLKSCLKDVNIIKKSDIFARI